MKKFNEGKMLIFFAVVCVDSPPYHVETYLLVIEEHNFTEMKVKVNY